MKTHSWILTAALLIGLSAAPAFAGGPCPGDADDNGTVDSADLIILLAQWGPGGGGGPADFNMDGTVDTEDLLILLAAWGPCPFAGVITTELAANQLGQFPWVEYVLAFNTGQTFEVALDPRFLSGGPTCDVYIVAAKNAAEWGSDPSLTDVRGSSQTETFNGATIQANTFTLTDSDSLDSDADLGIGVPYDLVCDCNQNGTLDGGDYVDSALSVTTGQDQKAGLYATHDIGAPGPLAVTEINYTVPEWEGQAGYGGHNTFYPTNIGTMGELPLLVVSRGNGHNYNWYDHIGNHIASYGWVVMSHNNHTEPGVFTASTTTLQHTDKFIEQLANIAGGVMDGHIDTDRIAWIGHSRGGEGVTIAYDRIFDGGWVPEFYTIDSLKFVSSMAPTDFLGASQTHPHGVNYHLWTAAGDADVFGCASFDAAQTFHLHDRAEQFRQSICIYGAGHGSLHNGSGSEVFSGPCPIGRANTHRIQLPYLLAMLKHYAEGNIPARDFITRQYESFRAIGAPTGTCFVNNLMYRDGDNGKFVVDDYQTQTGSGTSSSGGSVTFDVDALNENRLDDSNTNFTGDSGTMNGMTVGGTGDDTRGVVFEWDEADRFYEQEIIASERDFSDKGCLSFRSCQETRDSLTIVVLEDVTYDVTLRDGGGTTSTINVGAYGGGVEEPYQRTRCGTGTGWHNEFETIRIRLEDYLNNGSGLDLTDIVAVRFEFGPSHGSPEGRIGLDDIEVTVD